MTDALIPYPPERDPEPPRKRATEAEAQEWSRLNSNAELVAEFWLNEVKPANWPTGVPWPIKRDDDVPDSVTVLRVVK